MYKTKKDVDAHVRTALAKVRSENERNLRSFTIAKLYYKINEYSTAEQYLNAHLSVKEDNDQAHKLLGLCYQRLQKPEKALAAYQRSLQLNMKQPDILIEVCKLLLEDDNINLNKAKYWYELAETENIQHEAVFSLRLKLLNNENMKVDQVEALIQKEISNRPNVVQLHVRLVRHYIDQKQILHAFNYVQKLEMQQKDEFTNNDEWYNIVWLTLKKYEQMPNTKKDWDFWLLVIICLERLVQISFLHSDYVMSSKYANSVSGGATEIANHLFNLDQYLFKCDKIFESINSIQKEFLDLLMDHYRGQLLLHAATLLFKRELMHNRNKWKETVQVALPLLLQGVQIKPRNEEPWAKHIDNQNKHLVLLWQREASFRCAQIGRTLLSCIEDESSSSDQKQITEKDSTQFIQNNFFSLQTNVLWRNADELLAQVRQTCSDTQWRRNIFALLFCNSDQKVKEQSSYLLNSNKLTEPQYELPLYSDLEKYEELAQYLRPQSLQHMIYLHLSQDDLTYVRAPYFSGLPFSTENLSFCGTESLNQLDVESFLYAGIIQAQRVISIERENAKNLNTSATSILCKPRILPFANIKDQLGTEEQAEWWSALYTVYKNLSNGNDLAELRSTLQYGIEAVRGINGPKMDMAIVFKLGKIFMSRAKDVDKPVEKSFLEARANAIFKCALNMFKLHNKGVLEPFRKYFKYAQAQTVNAEKQMFNDAEDAVSYLASRYFKKFAYEDFIDEMTGIQLPFATYLQGEAYRQLSEISKSSKKMKHTYMDKYSECLKQSLALLKSSTYVKSDHPLKSIVPNEIIRLQHSMPNALYESSPLSKNFSPYNNSSTYEDAEEDFILENSIRSRRELTANHHHQQEIESLVKEMARTLISLKEDIIGTIKPDIQILTREMATIKGKMESKDALKPELQMVTKEMSSIKDKISNLEEVIRRMRISSNPPSRDDGSNVLDDLYVLEDAFQQQIYHPPQNTQTSSITNLQNTQYGNGITGPTYLNQQGRMSTAPNVLNMSGPYNNPAMYLPNAPNYPPINFYGQSNAFLIPPNMAHEQSPHQLHYGSTSITNQRSGGISLPYLGPMQTGNMHFNVTSQPMSLLPPSVTNDTSRCNNMYNLLQMQAPTHIPAPTQLTSFSTNIPLPPHVAQIQSFNMPPTINQTAPEKDIPVNVVITSSDPIPQTNNMVMQQQQPTLSVTIPSHHIKHSAVVSTNNKINSTSIVGTVTTITTITTTAISQSTINTSTTGFMFKSQIDPLVSVKNTTEPSLIINNTSTNSNDGRPNNIEPTTSLPGNIDMRTGEENEEVVFCEHAKLFYRVNKEWKNRGTGDIKILQSKDGNARILMRRDGTLKICANHKIIAEMTLTIPQNDIKGFIWAASDYADGELQLQTFFIRFESPEKAQQFQTIFKIVQKQLRPVNHLNKIMQRTSSPASTPPIATITKSPISNFATSTPGINSVPKHAEEMTTIFVKNNGANSSIQKNLFNATDNKSNAPLKSITTVASQRSDNEIAGPFAHFTFGQNTMATTSSTAIQPTGFSGTNISSPFSNIFSNINKANNTEISVSNASVATSNTASNLNKSSHSETEEEYIPTAQFKPVIPLPDLIEVNTGEENEIVLFEHRAKLLRYDKTAGEWKERGIGNMKLLQDKDDINKVRLLMRREQVHKLCCNQNLHKDTVFKYTNNPKTATKVMTTMTWAAQDFSENELTTEILAIRFKTAETCKQFHDCILEAQKKMSSENIQNDDINSSEEHSDNKNEDEKSSVRRKDGFGDLFKPKPGSWSCNDCYVPNTADTLYCTACNAPKDNTVAKTSTITATSNILNLTTNTTKSFNFGFTPFTMNVTKVTELDTTTKSTFKFGSITTPAITKVTTAITDDTNKNSTTTTATTTTTLTAQISSGFGDKFKPKAGSWNCDGCLVCNPAEAMHCQACYAPKDDTIPNKAKDNSGILTLNNPLQKFQFGFNTNKTESIGGDGGSINDTFNFSLEKPAFKYGSDSSFTFTPPTSISNENLASTTIPTTSSVLGKPNFTFTLASNVKDPKDETVINSKTIDAGGDNAPNIFSLDKKEFNFVLKPKSPGKASGKKSPSKLVGGGSDADIVESEDADGTYDAEEEDNTYFTPIIPLPDKIEVKTGEEDEELLYIHRAKLYRFSEGDWKERGLGNLKILRHKMTKGLRVVMRRDQVLKICLNHVLNSQVQYKRKDDRSWLFVVNDFSEGQVELEKFSLRFKTKDIAENFMTAINNALNNTAEEDSSTKSNNTPVEPPGMIDFCLTEKDKKKAEKLQLPCEFFITPSPCLGCRGCDSENFQFKEKQNEIFINQEDIKNPLLPMVLPPLKLSRSGNSSLLKQSALAPVVAAKLDINKKHTTLDEDKNNSNVSTGITVTTESILQAYKPINTTFSFSSALNDSATEPKTEAQRSDFFLGGLKSFTNESIIKPANIGNIFGGSNDAKETVKQSSGISSEDGSLKTSAPEAQQTISSTFGSIKSIFGGKSSEPIFGQNFSTSLFGQKTSIFGGATAPVLGTANSIFGGATNKPLVFGSAIPKPNLNESASYPPISGSGDSMFSTFAKPTNTITNTSNSTTISASTEFVDLSKTVTASVDFASLAAKAPTFDISTQKSKWNLNGGFIGLTNENAFLNFDQCKKGESDSKNDSKQNQCGKNDIGSNADGNNESEYDPHYEPVIELPDEIVVSTGEEEEEKVFGERAVLFRYDVDNKEWKERGVGELKILKHPVKQTYRMVMRREQIFKLILNHAIGADFKFSQMNNNPKSFVWGTMNYAESTDGVIERLAIRFKKVELAEQFSKTLNECIKACSNNLKNSNDK